MEMRGLLARIEWKEHKILRPCGRVATDIEKTFGTDGRGIVPGTAAPIVPAELEDQQLTVRPKRHNPFFDVGGNEFRRTGFRWQ